ncbi:hypothetical protein GCM10008986_21350 [Salinibacillus aidingensis]|uniref:Uncharacterized protein n=1 Tax=Salinibacillus aidingensis TaxID=237684 RepID=A0ABN1BBW0_9BACI
MTAWAWEPQLDREKRRRLIRSRSWTKKAEVTVYDRLGLRVTVEQTGTPLLLFKLSLRKRIKAI